MDRAQVRRWFSIKEAAPGASLPASEPASSKLKVCQLTVQGSSPPGQASCFAVFSEQGCAAKPSVRKPKENGQPYQQAG